MEEWEGCIIGIPKKTKTINHATEERRELPRKTVLKRDESTINEI